MSDRETPAVPVVGHVGWSPDYEAEPPDEPLWKCGACHSWDDPTRHECPFDAEAVDA